MEKSKKGEMAIASLVIGIIALLVAFSSFGGISIILGIISLILGIISLVKENKIVFSIIGIVLAISGILLGLFGTDTSNTATNSNVNNKSNVTNTTVTQSNAVENETRQEGEGSIGDYYVRIEECEVTKDYSGDPILLVKIAFTNNSNESKAFLYNVEAKAFQSGVEIQSPISTYGINNYDWKDKSNEIKPGVTYEFNLAFELKDKQSDVTVELTPYWSSNNSAVVSKTFKIAK